MFTVRPGIPRIEKGTCPHCGTRVTIGANGKRFAIVLPLLMLCVWMAWGMVSPHVLGGISGVVLLITVMQLDKAPPA
jgi:hypothetical protein